MHYDFRVFTDPRLATIPFTNERKQKVVGVRKKQNVRPDDDGYNTMQSAAEQKLGNIACFPSDADDGRPQAAPIDVVGLSSPVAYSAERQWAN